MTVRESVSVVVVTRRHSERLAATLKALERDGLIAHTVIANASGSRITHSTGAAVVDVPSSSSLSNAVSAALTGVESGLLWILRDDTTPRAGAFTALRSVLEASPTAGVVGPKQLDADKPGEILEMGESLSLTGRSVPLAERELDQGQYDRSSDVLAVGEAGMLVRREVWESLDGFDDRLAVIDGALDFCYRSRTAGWRVEIVPTATIDAVDNSLEAALGNVSTSRIQSEKAQAWVHRLLAGSVLWAMPFIAFAVVLGSLIRGFGRLILKKPPYFAEFSGALAGTLRIGAISASRKQRSAIATQSIGGTSLLVTRAEISRRRALERDAEVAARERLDSAPRLRFGHLGGWLTAGAGLVGAILYRNFIGAQAVSGGAMVPLDGSLSALWRSVGSTWSTAAAGLESAPDGFATLIALLGSMAPSNPNAAIVALWILAIPLSFVAAWVAVGAFHTSTAGSALAAAVWAMIPSLHIALGEGRLGAVLAHILIPLGVRALMGTGLVSAAWFALTAAALWVAVPALSPLIVLAIVVRAVAGRPWFVFTAIPALALEWPRILESLANSPLRYFADRGVPLPVVPGGAGALGVWPQLPVIPFLDSLGAAPVLWAVTAVFLAATVGVILAGNSRLGMLTAAGSLTVLWGSLLSPLTLALVDGTAVGVFSGPLTDVLWLAVAIGFGRAVSMLPPLLRIFSVPVVAALAALSIVSISAPLVGAPLASPSLARTVPAYVEAETNSLRGAGTLVISVRDETVIAEVRRNAGTTLSEWTASVSTRTELGANEPAVAALAGNLIVESGFDVVSAATALNIAFILLNDDPSSPTVSAISSHPGLARVGETDLGILWKVVGSTGGETHESSRHSTYLVIAGLVGLVTVIMAVPTSLPRRRRVEDDLAAGAGDDNG